MFDEMFLQKKDLFDLIINNLPILILKLCIFDKQLYFHLFNKANKPTKAETLRRSELDAGQYTRIHSIERAFKSLAINNSKHEFYFMNRLSIFKTLFRATAELILIVLLLAAIAPQAISGCRVSFLKSPQDSLYLRKNFHDLVDQKLRTAKVVMPTDVRDSINKLVDAGVDNLIRENTSNDSIKKAQENLNLFIESVISNGEVLRGRKIRVNKDSVKKAKKRICTIFPFC